MGTSASSITPYLREVATMAATQAATQAARTFTLQTQQAAQQLTPQKPVLPLSTLQAILSTSMSPDTMERVMRNLEQTHTLPMQLNHHRSLATELMEPNQPAQLPEMDQFRITQPFKEIQDRADFSTTQDQLDPDIQGTMTQPDSALDMLVDGILSMPDHLLVRRHGLPAAPMSTHQDTPVRRQETLIIHPEALEDQQPNSRLRQGPLLLNKLIQPLRRTLINHQRLILMRQRSPLPTSPLSSTTPMDTNNLPTATPTVLIGSEILI